MIVPRRFSPVSALSCSQLRCIFLVRSLPLCPHGTSRLRPLWFKTSLRRPLSPYGYLVLKLSHGYLRPRTICHSLDVPPIWGTGLLVRLNRTELAAFTESCHGRRRRNIWTFNDALTRRTPVSMGIPDRARSFLIVSYRLTCLIS